MNSSETRVIKRRQYTVVDKYDVGMSPLVHDKTDIAILERNGKYYIQNYEGMDLFLGPFDHAVKTGDNGEILVRDIGRKSYYVPGIKREKPSGIGFLKEYHPEYHFAEPYVYGKRLKAAAKMTDGTIHMKHSTGYLDPEPLKYYYDTGLVEIFEDIKGYPRGRAHNLELPLDYPVRPDDPAYPPEGSQVFAILEAYAKYKEKAITLDDLPHFAFLNESFLRCVLYEEQDRVKKEIVEAADLARDELEFVAKAEDLEKIAEVDIDETVFQERLNTIAKTLVDKRTVAVQESEKKEALEKKEHKTASSVTKILDFDSIVKKSNAKPRKKKAQAPKEEQVEQGEIPKNSAGETELGE